MNNRRINLQKLLSLGYHIKISDGQAISGDPYAIIVDRNITDLEFDKIIDDKLQKVTTNFTWLTDVKMQSSDCGKKFKNLKWFKRFDKNNELDYLNYLIQYVEGNIHNQNIKLSKKLDKFDIYKELLKIENNLIFSDNNTISYFTKKTNK